jgi:hypothetical protein
VWLAVPFRNIQGWVLIELNLELQPSNFVPLNLLTNIKIHTGWYNCYTKRVQHQKCIKIGWTKEYQDDKSLRQLNCNFFYFSKVF